MGKFVETEQDAMKIRDEIQKVLDADWNVGDRRFDLGSTISGGKYLAMIHEGWPPTHFPATRPHYE